MWRSNSLHWLLAAANDSKDRSHLSGCGHDIATAKASWWVFVVTRIAVVTNSVCHGFCIHHLCRNVGIVVNAYNVLCRWISDFWETFKLCHLRHTQSYHRPRHPHVPRLQLPQSPLCKSSLLLFQWHQVTPFTHDHLYDTKKINLELNTHPKINLETFKQAPPVACPECIYDPPWSRVWSLISYWLGKTSVFFGWQIVWCAKQPFRRRHVKLSDLPYLLSHTCSRADYRCCIIHTTVLNLYPMERLLQFWSIVVLCLFQSRMVNIFVVKSMITRTLQGFLPWHALPWMSRVFSGSICQNSLVSSMFKVCAGESLAVISSYWSALF